MITRELKLQLKTKQKNQLNNWLFQLTGVYNWATITIELNAKNKIYFSKFDFINSLSKHSKTLKIPSHTIQGTLAQAYTAWNRCFKKVSKQPKLKSVRNKLNSIPFPDPIPSNRIKNKLIRIPRIGWVKFYKQKLPAGSIKRAIIVRRTSGWYLQLTTDNSHKFSVKDVDKKIGIDTGFKHLAILSDGTKFKNKRNFVKGQKRLAQAQRGKRKKLTAQHDRDINAAKVILNFGLRYSLDNVTTHVCKGPGICKLESSGGAR